MPSRKPGNRRYMIHSRVTGELADYETTQLAIDRLAEDIARLEEMIKHIESSIAGLETRIVFRT